MEVSGMLSADSGPASKNLPVKDVAAARGWKDVTTLINCYQQPDEETLRSVVEYERPRIQTQVRTAGSKQMSSTERYMQSGTGQVFHLTTDPKTGNSSVEAFAGGPKTASSDGALESREEALEWLKQQDCSPFTEEEKEVTHTQTHTLPQIGEARHDLNRCRASLPLLGSNQDSPDPESVPLGQRFRSSCPETVTYRASVPASLPQNARFCPEKL